MEAVGDAVLASLVDGKIGGCVTSGGTPPSHCLPETHVLRYMHVDTMTCSLYLRVHSVILFIAIVLILQKCK